MLFTISAFPGRFLLTCWTLSETTFPYNLISQHLSKSFGIFPAFPTESVRNGSLTSMWHALETEASNCGVWACANMAPDSWPQFSWWNQAPFMAPFPTFTSTSPPSPLPALSSSALLTSVPITDGAQRELCHHPPPPSQSALPFPLSVLHPFLSWLPACGTANVHFSLFLAPLQECVSVGCIWELLRVCLQFVTAPFPR